MSDLRIPITSDLLVAMIRALDNETSRPDFHEWLYDHGAYLCEAAGDVAAIRALEKAAMYRDLTEAERTALDGCSKSNFPWLRKNAESILQDIADRKDDRAACDASTVDDQPVHLGRSA